MKNFLKGFAAFAVIAATMAFRHLPNPISPSEVAINFTKAILIANFDSAKMYVTSNSVNLMDQTEKLYKNATPLPDSLKQILSQPNITVMGENKIDDSTTSVNLSIKFPKPFMGHQEAKKTLILKKEKDEWKVELMATTQNKPANNDKQQAIPADTALSIPRDTAIIQVPPTK